MPDHPERRRASRVATDLSGRLIVPGSPEVPLEIEELSLVGLRGRSREALPVGQACRVEIQARAGWVDVRGTVVRARDGLLAVRFDHLPYESFERLKAFLLVNARDPAVLADELDERLGFLGESA